MLNGLHKQQKDTFSCARRPLGAAPAVFKVVRVEGGGNRWSFGPDALGGASPCALPGFSAPTVSCPSAAAVPYSAVPPRLALRESAYDVAAESLCSVLPHRLCRGSSRAGKPRLKTVVGRARLEEPREFSAALHNPFHHRLWFVVDHKPRNTAKIRKPAHMAIQRRRLVAVGVRSNEVCMQICQPHH